MLVNRSRRICKIRYFVLLFKVPLRDAGVDLLSFDNLEILLLTCVALRQLINANIIAQIHNNKNPPDDEVIIINFFFELCVLLCVVVIVGVIVGDLLSECILLVGSGVGSK